MSNSSSPELAALWRQFLRSKESTTWSRYAMVGCATVAIYDILLTLSDEIELVWMRNLWTFPTLLYIGNRYVTLATVMVMTYSVSPFRPPLDDAGVSIAGFSVGLASWGGIMALRVTALWKRNRTIVWFVWATWISMVLIMTTGAVVLYFSMLPTLRYDRILGICTGISHSHVQAVLPAIQASFVMIVTLLTVIKAYQFGSPFRNIGGGSSVMCLLLGDGVMCFLVVSVLSFASGICWLILVPEMNRVYLSVYLSWIVYSSLVARLFLRLRKRFYKSYSATLSGITQYSATTTAWATNPDLDFVIEHDIASGFFRDDEFAILDLPHQITPAVGAPLSPRDDESFSCAPLSPGDSTSPLSARGSAIPLGSFLPNLTSPPPTPTHPPVARPQFSRGNSYCSILSRYTRSTTAEATNGRPSTAGTGRSINVVNARPITATPTANLSFPVSPSSTLSSLLTPKRGTIPSVSFARASRMRPRTSPSPVTECADEVDDGDKDRNVTRIPLRILTSRPAGLSPPPRPRNSLSPSGRAIAPVRPHTAPAVEATVFVELYRNED